MINIIYTTLLFNILIIAFKLFDRYNVNNLQALTANYMTAAFLSFCFIKTDFSFSEVLQSDWILHAFSIGTLFIIVFYFYSIGIQKAGISITTIANKMSLIIPVSAALLLYPENNSLDVLKIIAFLLAILGIYLATTDVGKLKINRKYLWLIIFVFLGQGISDAIFNDFAQRFSNLLDNSSFLFFMLLFIFASISGLIMIFLNDKFSNFQSKNIIWGIAFGVPNFFSLVFFLEALNDGSIPSSIVFPIVSMLIVISSSLIGLLFFNEKLSRNNWIGILIATISIYLLSN